MKLTLLTTLVLLGTLSATIAAEVPDPSLLFWLPLDEGFGSFAADRSKSQIEAELTNVQWAKGEFGTAARFGGTKSFIDVPAVPSLDGATQFTISLWATWEGTGSYPNLLTTRNWSPGGLMLFVRDKTCSFRIGRPGDRSGKAGGQWTETSAPLLKDIPLQKWTHVCVVFAMPNITTYVNGKVSGRANWSYPVQATDLRLGTWSGSACHNGLIGDVRIYGRALAEAEVAGLARDPARSSAAYALVDESKAAMPLAATFANDRVSMAVDVRGRVVSLQCKASQHELLADPRPMVAARLKDGRMVRPRKASLSGNTLTFEFPRGQGVAAIAVDTHKDFFTFTIRSLTLPDVAALTFCELAVTPTKYRGSMANMLSDDTEAVCLRGYDLPVEMLVGGNPPVLRVSTTAELGLTGWRAGLAAGLKKEMPAMIRAMAVVAGVPVSKLGGPWSLGAEANRGSYLFADLSLASADEWIDLARRGGFTHIHIHGWWQRLGHYDIRKSSFPNGLDDMKETVARIHAAGLKAGIHTLTACINPSDPWVTPEASPHLMATDSYTLARPMTPLDTVIYVNEKPSRRHDVVFTYSGNGNAIRIGTEIVQYSEVVSEPPYAFAKCQRGAFKTHATAHAAGGRADYLQQRYIAFYPQPGSPLADELADCIARVFNTCQLDQIYFDGSEGMRTRYGIDFMRHAIFKRLKGEVLAEASCHGAHNWWFHSRIGAWDHPVWAAKRFQDRHIASASAARDADLLEPQMGWWAPRRPTPQARGHFLDEMEYFAAKNLGLDAAMSIQGVNVTRDPLPFHTTKQITLLGWYERLRLARYFDAQTIARVAVLGDEFRLRQNRDGRWQFTPVKMAAHRITGLDNGSQKWTTVNPFAEQPVTARVEALYSASPYDSPNRICATDFADLAAFRQATSSSAVSLRLEETTDDVRGGPRNLRMVAQNKGVSRKGAWARAGLAFAAPYRRLSGTGAMGAWIKGDGKGALLNIQLACPREYMGAQSDHYVTLDFTGWRYVELLLRERDVERMGDYQWPYDGSYSIFRNALDLVHVSEVNLYLNDLPSGDRTEVVLGPIMALPVQPAGLKNPAITLNGQTLTVPVTMKSGDFVEIEASGDCCHYDEKGDLQASVRPTLIAGLPVERSGDNTVAFRCEPGAGATGRAEVTLIALGTPFGTVKPRAEIAWKHLAREYEMPRWITAKADTWDVFVRPGEKARLEIDITGALESPALTIGGHESRFPVALKAGQHLVSQGNRHWVVIDAARAVVAEGDLPDAPPLLKGGANHVAFTCAAPDRAVVKLVKVYEP
jgi:hypothetical protein